MQRLALQANAVLEGAFTQNEGATRVAVDTMRQLKADLAQVPAQTLAMLDNGHAPRHLRDELSRCLEQIGKADTFMPLWCQRYRAFAGQAAERTPADAANILLDEQLPLIWDWAHDLIVILGAPMPDLMAVLGQRGQKRIWVVEQVADLKKRPECLARSALAPRRFAPLVMPNITQELQAVAASFQPDIDTMPSPSTRLHDSVWLQQYLKNLPLIQRSDHVSVLKDGFKDKPLVFVAPGPSLDKNIQTLKKIAPHVTLLAAVQAAKALSAAGIVADYMVLVDPKDFSYVLDGADLKGVKALIAGVSCHESFLSRFNQVIFCNVNNELDDWLRLTFGPDAVTGRGGSVAVTALNLALYMGANPIVLVGQDLALTNGQVYSEQSVLSQVKVKLGTDGSTFTYQNCSDDYLRTGQEEGEDRTQQAIRALKLPGFYGGEVLTRPDFYLCQQDMAGIAAQVSQTLPGVQLFNCTEGGAYIPGFEHRALQSCMAQMVSGEVVA